MTTRSTALGEDRAGVERLLRYCARPPFALERLYPASWDTLIRVADTTIPWFSPEGHGTAEQRLLLVLVGVVNGPSGCLDPDFFVIFPTEGPAQQMAPPPNPLGRYRITAGR
jgi:hypothetical protein